MAFEQIAVFEEVSVKVETDKAILVVIEDKEYWIPKSQIAEDSEVYAQDTAGTLIVSQWIAQQKGLI